MIYELFRGPSIDCDFFPKSQKFNITNGSQFQTWDARVDFPVVNNLVLVSRHDALFYNKYSAVYHKL